MIATLLFVALAGWFCLYRPEFSALGGHLVASALFSENVWLSHETGYFDVQAYSKPTLHLWSLAIEEQFYAFWPILLSFAYRRRIGLPLWFASLAATSFLINLLEVRANPTAAYFSPLARAWEFIIGAALADWKLNAADPPAGNADILAGAGATLIALALLFVTPNMAFPGPCALLPTLGAALVIAGGEQAWINRRLLSAGPLVGCGLISYPLYLWHWPLLSFARIVLGEPSTMAAIACVCVSVLAALLSYRFVERPLRAPARTRIKMRFLVGAMSALAACGLLTLTQLLAPRLKTFDAPGQTEWDFLKARTTHFDKNGTGVYALGADRRDRVLFIGDSHVAQYAARLDELIAEDKTRPGVVLAVGGGCIPIEGVATSDYTRAGCGPLRSAAWDMAENGKFAAIIVGGAWNWYFRSGDYRYVSDGEPLALTSSAGRRAALDRLARRLQSLIRSGKKVVLLLDNPESDAFSSAKWPIRLDATFVHFEPNRVVRIDAGQVELRDELIRFAHEIGVAIIDPFGAVCAGGLCRVTTSAGRPIYKDTNHFNPAWTIGEAAFIDAALDAPMPKRADENAAGVWTLRPGIDPTLVR